MVTIILETTNSDCPNIKIYPSTTPLSTINQNDTYEFESSSNKTPAAVITEVSIFFTRFYPEIEGTLINKLSSDLATNDGVVGFMKTNVNCKYTNSSGKCCNYKLSVCGDCLLKGRFFGGFKTVSGTNLRVGDL